MRALVALLGAAAVAACGGSSAADNPVDAGSDAGAPKCNNTCPTAGAKQCLGPQIQTCVADQNGCLSWSLPAACTADQFCNPGQNACVACNSNCSTEGATQCSGASNFQRCTTDANGCKFLSAPAACPQGQACDANQHACVTTALASCPSPAAAIAGSVSGPATDPGTCQLPKQTSSLASGQVQSLGTHTVREANPIPFTIQPNTGSFTVMLQAVGDAGTTVTVTAQGQSATIENSAFPSRIAQPDGGVILDAVTPDDGPDAGIWQPFAPGTTSAITAPNTSLALTSWADGGVPAGTWNLSIDDYADYLCLPDAGFSFRCTNPSFTDQYDVSVLTRGPLPLPGTLDLAIYLVSESTKTPLQNAAQAANAPEVQRMISSLRSIYARAGICIGNVTVRDVPAWAKAKYSTIDSSKTSPCDPLNQMFTLSQPDVNELNLFLVDDITQPSSSGGGQIVGIDGAIPGPSSFGGTVHSGAVVNASDISFQFASCGAGLDVIHCGADEVAYIAAHEGGHWMGLYHPTEATGDFFDPLSDTGTCRCTSCVTGTRLTNCEETNPNTNSPTFMVGSDCNKGPFVPQCDGSQLLMFWLIDRTSVGNVSSHQSQVMRLNPLVR